MDVDLPDVPVHSKKTVKRLNFVDKRCDDTVANEKLKLVLITTSELPITKRKKLWKDLPNTKRKKLWQIWNNKGSYCCMEKIEEKEFGLKVCKTFVDNDEMLFQHWDRDHDLGANV